MALADSLVLGLHKDNSWNDNSAPILQLCFTAPKKNRIVTGFYYTQNFIMCIFKTVQSMTRVTVRSVLFVFILIAAQFMR